MKLTLVGTQRGFEGNPPPPSHRAAASEGEAAVKLLEANGYHLKLKKSTGQYQGACPFHEDAGSGKKDPNFYLDANTSMFYCHSARCGQRGNLQTLERHFGFDANDRPGFMTREKRLQVYEASLGPSLRQPFHDHGLDDETIERFRLGWDNEHQHYVLPYLEGRRPRVFRFYSPEGNGPNGTKYWWEEGSTARLYNVDDAVGDEEGRVFICEGEQKAMLLCQLGFAAVATPGAGIFKDEWYAHFNHARKIYIVFDNDNPEYHVHDNCVQCTGECRGHNPGQEGAMKLLEAFDWRAHNVLMPLPDEDARKTDVNEFFIRDGNSMADFAELALGEKKNRYRVQTLAEIFDNPPEESDMLVEQGILPAKGRLLVTGAPKAGKAQPLDAPVLTPSGWTQMGQLQVGDDVVGSDGRAKRVVQVHPQGTVPIYRVTTSDGVEVECCGDHLWAVETKEDRIRGRGARTMSTLELKEAMEQYLSLKWFLPLVSPVHFDDPEPLLIDPYALGLLIGDGTFRLASPQFTSGDPELMDALDAHLPGLTVNPANKRSHQIAYISDENRAMGNRLTDMLTRLGLWGKGSREKFIPWGYMKAAPKDRFKLLQGLMDTDGGMDGKSVSFYTSSEKLCENVVELVQSLGGRAKVTEKTATASYIIRINLPNSFGCPFRLQRKVELWKSRSLVKREPTRRIVEISYVRDDEAQCITIESDDSLYVTNGYVLTHNSIWVQNLALSLGAGIPFLHMFDVAKPTRVLLLDREISRRALYERMEQLIRYRPGYRAAFDNLHIDHDIMFRLDRKGAYDILAELVEQNGSEVVVFDTAYKFLSGDVESSHSISKAFDVLDRLIAKAGVSVVLTHHHRKGQRRDGKDESPHPDQVVGSFLWTGWPNATTLLNFHNRRVEDPFNTVCYFTAFRDAAPPEPVMLNRTRDSIAYSSIKKYDEGEHDFDPPPKATKPTTDIVANMLLRMCPIDEESFLHAAANKLGVRTDTVKPYFIDALQSPHFEKEGKPPIIRFVGDEVEEETWEQEHMEFASSSDVPQGGVA